MLRMFAVMILVFVTVVMLMMIRTKLTMSNPHVLSPITIEQIRETAELITLTVPLQQVVQAEVKGYTGSTKCLVLTVGEASIGCDLSSASVEVDATQKQVVVTLPHPSVRSARLDQQATQVFAVHRSGLWQVLPGSAGEGEVVQKAMRQAEQVLADAGAQARHVEQARRQTERVLADLAGSQEWQVEVAWTPP